MPRSPTYSIQGRGITCWLGWQQTKSTGRAAGVAKWKEQGTASLKHSEVLAPRSINAPLSNSYCYQGPNKGHEQSYRYSDIDDCVYINRVIIADLHHRPHVRSCIKQEVSRFFWLVESGRVKLVTLSFIIRRHKTTYPTETL
jgi:hypothetical protein